MVGQEAERNVGKRWIESAASKQSACFGLMPDWGRKAGESSAIESNPFAKPCGMATHYVKNVVGWRFISSPSSNRESRRAASPRQRVLGQVWEQASLAFC